MTESLVERTQNPPVNEPDPMVEFLLQFAEPDLPRGGWSVSLAPEHSTIGAEKMAKLLQELVDTKHENAKLRQQVKQQFRDLAELDSVMDELESQVDGHETVIKQQSHRIQEQEETILHLNTRMQQYAAALVFKNRLR